ncbi:MAG: M23 family metallopeptidase [Thermoleophilaceae bacterium]
MRFASIALSTAFLGLALLPVAASADGGGATSPTAGGGAMYAQPVSEQPAQTPRHRRRHRRKSRRRGPLLTQFRLARSRLFLYGRPARVTFTIKSRYRTVLVRLRVVRPGQRRALSVISLGQRPTGIRQTYVLTGRENGILSQGGYTLRIGARDRRGRSLRHSSSIGRTTDLRFLHHRFPLAGPFGYGGPDARFGTPRTGHTHQGQDLVAATGTPIVAPRGGTVTTVQYQAGGAGNYVVLSGESESYDYVFMHLRTGSTRVRVGQHVRTGQRLGDVGATGDASGPHLHFEIWRGTWFGGGHPIDPLPFLRRWDRWS